MVPLGERSAATSSAMGVRGPSLGSKTSTSSSGNLTETVQLALRVRRTASRSCPLHCDSKMLRRLRRGPRHEFVHDWVADDGGALRCHPRRLVSRSGSHAAHVYCLSALLNLKKLSSPFFFFFFLLLQHLCPKLPQRCVSERSQLCITVSLLACKADALELLVVSRAARGAPPERVNAHLWHGQPVLLCLFDVDDERRDVRLLVDARRLFCRQCSLEVLDDAPASARAAMAVLFSRPVATIPCTSMVSRLLL